MSTLILRLPRLMDPRSIGFLWTSTERDPGTAAHNDVILDWSGYMRLRDIMTVGIVTIGPHNSASDARGEMQRHRVRHLVVVDGERVVGVISDGDLGAANGRGLDGLTVQALMTSEVVSATPETTVRQAANLMLGCTIECLLVVENEQTLGLVTTTDLLNELGRGTIRSTVRTEAAPLRRPPGSGRVRGKKAVRRTTGPRRGRRSSRAIVDRSPLPASLGGVALDERENRRVFSL
jgi:CBS domain-containing protein